MNIQNFDLTFLGKFIYLMFKTLELPGGGGALPPWPPYQGFALDPLGALSGPQTPRPIILHPPILIPGYGPGMSLFAKTDPENFDYITCTNFIVTNQHAMFTICILFSTLTTKA